MDVGTGDGCRVGLLVGSLLLAGWKQSWARSRVKRRSGRWMRGWNVAVSTCAVTIVEPFAGWAEVVGARVGVMSSQLSAVWDSVPTYGW